MAHKEGRKGVNFKWNSQKGCRKYWRYGVLKNPPMNTIMPISSLDSSLMSMAFYCDRLAITDCEKYVGKRVGKRECDNLKGSLSLIILSLLENQDEIL